MPRSPVDWVGATTFTGKFLGIFVLVFLTMRLVQVKKSKGSTRDDYLIIGLGFLCSTLLMGMFLPNTGIWFWAINVLRVGYTVPLFFYAWKLEPNNIGC